MWCIHARYFIEKNLTDLHSNAHQTKGDINYTSSIEVIFIWFQATADTFFVAAIWDIRTSVGSESVIIWDRPLINPGGHYSNVTGGYTAPYDGYYQ